MSDIGARTTMDGPAVCANCHAPLTGPYCAACGQPHNVHRGSIGKLLRDLVEDMISFDSRILRTARALVLQPGELTRAFHQGRTQPYVPAVRLYLFVSLLFFLVLSASGVALLQFGTERTEAGAQPTLIFLAPLKVEDPAAAAQPLAHLGKTLESEGLDTGSGSLVSNELQSITQTLFAHPAALNDVMTEWLPRILFALLPLFALLLQLVYWRRRDFLFVDHLVFSLNFHSFGFVLLTAAALTAQVLPAATLAWGAIFILALHLLLAMALVYRERWLTTGLKFAAVGAIYVVFFLVPAFIGIFVMAMVGDGSPAA